MYSEKILNELEEIVNKGLEEVSLPYQKGNSIRIKHIAIRKSSKGYLIYNTKENTQVARTQFKSTAIAIAKNLAQGRDIVDKISNLDVQLLKHYNDAMFYKNVIKKTKDPQVLEIREVRLEISLTRSEQVRKQLDRYIFN
jgi:hypothetical protein